MRVAAIGDDEHFPAALDKGQSGHVIDLATGAAQGVLQVAGAPELASIMTLTLVTESVQGDGTGIAGFPGEPIVARVKWGTRDFAASAEIDYVNGCSLTLPAGSIQLTAQRESSGAGAPALARVGAFLAYLPKAATIPPQRTRSIDAAIASQGSAPLVDIPQFAGRVIVQRTPITESLRLEFLNRNGDEIYEVIVGGGQNGPRLEISNDARRIKITNTGANPIDRVRLIFELML